MTQAYTPEFTALLAKYGAMPIAETLTRVDNLFILLTEMRDALLAISRQASLSLVIRSEIPSLSETRKDLERINEIANAALTKHKEGT